MTKSTFLHLRFPFSFFLLPVFLFAVAVSQPTDWTQLALVFFVLHLLLYPASNGYNSYFDQDEGSIGGLEHPPETTKNLYYWSLILDGAALLLALRIDWKFSFMLLIYGLMSKAYSHPSVRLKKRPVLGWLAVGLFQGYFTFLMTVYGTTLTSFDALMTWEWQCPALLSSLLLWGSYPMTQVYQHEEDRERGDMTISLKLGILGTFYFTGVFFTVATLGFFLYFRATFSDQMGLLFIIFLIPVTLYFFNWFLKVRKDESQADFRHTMRLNFVSALMLNLFFLIFALNL
ncbi:1,4-dihydroxy-2-naphthoate octaprenyltransferase [Reichenbachiella faecimaris]|uniref:1,4-dihydroxy-2-naphthoate octaprenyltransferase n=1 Tax=Reichenbachiella faecimaris TaxID=692418 RepID=A0A1W2GFE8_REIFA|nr:UbiA family prenyltransferase [Reichenbachiella faecimaris]SMD35375.1 1,4-dihydroxy-2-naphthoate octaprenyltransferase [Reichenbachiella faecimaris]